MYDISIHSLARETPALGWATRWDAAACLGDWSIAAADDPVNPGGLGADRQIASAVIISLFTDRRAPEGWRPEVADRRGWWGDGVAPEGEAPEPIGSWLWLLRNEVATPANADLAKGYAQAALAWMLRDGVAVRIDVTSGIIDQPERGLWLNIDIYGRDGQRVFNRRFERLWREEF